MKLAILLMLTGCAKNGLINKARNHFPNGSDCIEILRGQIEKQECNGLQVEYTQNSTMIRCNKEDKDRGRFWDNYMFRITSAKLSIDPKWLAEIEEHTICMDDNVRIEAWPPPKK